MLGDCARERERGRRHTSTQFFLDLLNTLFSLFFGFCGKLVVKEREQKIKDSE
jgi:hypothetical protein